MSLTQVGIAVALVLVAGCVERPPSVVEAEPNSATVESTTSTPSTPTPPAPTTPPPTPTSIPAHGLASLERVCELIVTIANQDGTGEDYSCEPERGVYEDEKRVGVLTASALASYHLPVVQGAAGWSVFPSFIFTWESGTELNVVRRTVGFNSWLSDVYGELIVIDIKATTTDEYDDWVDEEDHWRKVICVASSTPRCTSPILYRVERGKRRDGLIEPVSHYEAKLRVDGGDLVVEVSDHKADRVYGSDVAARLDAGRYPLEQLFAAGSEVWQAGPY